MQQYSSQTEQLKESEQSAAFLIETLNPVHVGQREIELAEALNLVQKAGLKLVAKGKGLVDVLAEKIPAIVRNPEEYAEVLEAVRELNNAAETFAMLNVPSGSPDGFEKCNILEINDELGIAVLSAGYRDGVRVNMSLQCGENGENLLRVVSLRPFVCGAVLEQGDIRKLTAGMEVRPARVQLKQ